MLRPATHAVLGLAMVLAFGAAAVAQPRGPSAEQGRLLGRARAAQDVGRFDEAARLLREARALAPSLRLSSALAFALFRAGELRAARQEASACLDDAADATTPEAADLRRVCADIIVRIAQASADDPPAAAPHTPDPGATATAEPRPVAPPQAPQAIEAPEAPGGGAERAPPRSLEGVDAAVRSPAREGPEAVPPSAGVPVGAVTTLGVGVLSLGLGGLMVGLRASVLAPCALSGEVAVCPDEATREAAARAPDYAMAANVSLVAGAALSLGGALWWALASRSSGSARRVAVTPGGFALRF
ncbi:MAG: hypothetical protein JNK72_02610 [Myxococcales bacterium]|nr:hypothetical protein [Myxococcales bacterium]